MDVQGIDNHQLTDIPIVTAAGVAESQRGPVVLIVHQCAHMKQGNTTHSSTQLEAHGVDVDDRAIANGGQQHIITHAGCVTPSHVRSGLVCMDMRPPTDAELKDVEHGGLSQVILMLDLD